MNLRAPGQFEGTWQKVPDVRRVLSELGIHGAYSEHWYICSDHGQDPRRPLAAGNLPGRAANAVGIVRAAPVKRRSSAAGLAANVTPPKRVDTTRSPSKRGSNMTVERVAREQERELRHHREQLERKQQEESKRAAAAAVQTLARRRRAMQQHGDDPGETIDSLLKKVDSVCGDMDALYIKLEEAEDEKSYWRARVQSFRPETFDDVDDAWVHACTMFNDKAACQAFFETHVSPRIDDFEKWQNFMNHRMQPSEFAAAFLRPRAADAAADAADEPSEILKLLGRREQPTIGRRAEHHGMRNILWPDREDGCALRVRKDAVQGQIEGDAELVVVDGQGRHVCQAIEPVEHCLICDRWQRLVGR